MISCVVIDDEQLAIDVIINYIQRIPGLELIGTTTNPLEGINLIKELKPNVVFLDIEMDEMNGVDLMKIIGYQTSVIFCTAYSQFAVESYELDAVDYLVKPVPFNRFVKAIQRLSSSLLKESSPFKEEAIANDYIFIKTEQKGKMVKIDFDDILYIEGMSNYVAFHRREERTVAYLTLKEIEDRLPSSQFMRVHKSYIVSLKQIDRLENGSLVIKKIHDKVPLSNSYRDSFLEKIRGSFM